MSLPLSLSVTGRVVLLPGEVKRSRDSFHASVRPVAYVFVTPYNRVARVRVGGCPVASMTSR